VKTKRLIINADGYGFTPGVTRGIEEAVEGGVVTSISVNSNFEAVWPLKEFIERNPRVSVGVHLNPVAGRPIADPKDVPTLVDENGEFHFQSCNDNLDELALELGLQIERVQQLVPTVTHIDSHQNRHLWPKFFKVFIAVGKKYGIRRMRTHAHRVCMEYVNRRMMTVAFYVTHPKRVATHGFARYLMWKARREGMRMCDRMLSVGVWGQKGRKAMLDVWLQVARGCAAGTNEIYCHPGYVDDELRRWARGIIEQREEELKVMTDPRLREEFERNGVERISFHDI
jgi:predicted glycoside hydrolase/deacetylase ChbG (UPF0249 family)